MVNSSKQMRSFIEALNQDEIAKTIIGKTINTKFKIDGTWTINSGKVDVDGSVRTKGKMSRLPFSFGKVEYHFDCANSDLTTLVGSPSYVGDIFDCSRNLFTNLIGGPNEVNEFNCWNHELTSLEGLPAICRRFYISYSPELPLLRLVGKKILSMDNMGNVINPIGAMKILQKYQDQTSRSTILACQKELIDNGFEGNASW